MSAFSARLYSGVRGGSKLVRVELVDDAHIRLLDTQVNTTYALDELRIHDRLASLPAVLELPSGARLEIADSRQFFAALQPAHKRRNNAVFYLEAHWSLMLI